MILAENANERLSIGGRDPFCQVMEPFLAAPLQTLAQYEALSGRADSMFQHYRLWESYTEYWRLFVLFHWPYDILRILYCRL